MGGKLAVTKGSFAMPSLLRYPVTGLSATVFLEDEGPQRQRLRVEALDARVGRRGHIRVRGQLPLQPPPRRCVNTSCNVCLSSLAPGQRGKASSAAPLVHRATAHCMWLGQLAGIIQSLLNYIPATCIPGPDSVPV